ncbi:MAG: type II toxin-antitoxin system VapC family toxin [Deltaproteobacteria bacterium]|nr:type II toxin-antitoxin system VapC family toxin [Deltaproteobacteria bacterium]
MTNGDGDRIFLDTNVLVYANAAESPLHQIALSAIETRYDAGVELWISRQVLREYLATFSRPQRFMNPRPIATVIERVRYFQNRFRVAEDGPHVTERLLALMQQVSIGGKQVHDANIVATMLAYGIPSLLTHNTDDFVRFSGHITVLPLETSAS